MNEEFTENENNGKENGVYADCFRVAHSAYKFVFDFGQSDEGSGSTGFHTRIMTGPATAKVSLEMFTQLMKQYEEHYGLISRGD